MALVFIEKRKGFKGEGAFDTPDSHSFDKNVKSAHVVLRGFKIFFDSTANPTVTVQGSVGALRLA